MNPYYDYEHMTDAGAEVDLASMVPAPKRAVFSKNTSDDQNKPDRSNLVHLK